MVDPVERYRLSAFTLTDKQLFFGYVKDPAHDTLLLIAFDYG